MLHLTPVFAHNWWRQNRPCIVHSSCTCKIFSLNKVFIHVTTVLSISQTRLCWWIMINCYCLPPIPGFILCIGEVWLFFFVFQSHHFNLFKNKIFVKRFNTTYKVSTSKSRHILKSDNYICCLTFNDYTINKRIQIMKTCIWNTQEFKKKCDNVIQLWIYLFAVYTMLKDLTAEASTLP